MRSIYNFRFTSSWDLNSVLPVWQSYIQPTCLWPNNFPNTNNDNRFKNQHLNHPLFRTHAITTITIIIFIVIVATVVTCDLFFRLTNAAAPAAAVILSLAVALVLVVFGGFSCQRINKDWDCSCCHYRLQVVVCKFLVRRLQYVTSSTTCRHISLHSHTQWWRATGGNFGITTAIRFNSYDIISL